MNAIFLLSVVFTIDITIVILVAAPVKNYCQGKLFEAETNCE